MKYEYYQFLYSWFVWITFLNVKNIFQFEADTCIVLKIPIEEIVEAFNEMKLRNPNLYKTPKEKTTKFQERYSDSESDSDWKLKKWLTHFLSNNIKCNFYIVHIIIWSIGITIKCDANAFEFSKDFIYISIKI